MIPQLRTYIALSLLCLMSLSCSHQAQVPDTFIIYNEEPVLLPDYRQVTIPPNIAPLNFSICDDSVTDCVADFAWGTGRASFGHGREVIIDPDTWHTMLQSARGDSLHVQLYTLTGDGEWRQHPGFSIAVATDSIDPYVAYRLIPPYNTYERISLSYRCLEDYTETEFYNNQMLDAPRGGHCINCHAFQDYHTERMQFHVREEFGGTVIYDHGRIGKHDLKRPETISGGVYPAWHPTQNLIAYSTNKSFMEFHTNGLCKSEVQDSQSGLILYDVAHDRVIPICDESDQMETFPAWSPDGRWLYYCMARFSFEQAHATDAGQAERIGRQHEVTSRYRDVRYDIYRRSFCADSLSFGEAELVLDASSTGHSATLPRISPDGRWLLTCIGDYGCFHIYHPEADLYVMDLNEGQASLRPLTEANSASAESYHNWSSNGRWMVFQSRRRDDNYTRLYFSYFDRQGQAHRAFELPQRDPDYELLHLRSYNIPEFICEPVRAKATDFARAIAQ